tara:strand:- start:1870 stop:2445 length:576 start_codon:yes stop_codon:yes gene_type:complete
MSEYFTNLPIITYDLDRKKPSTEYLAVDIFRRNFVREQVLSNVVSYYPYQVQEGERPDTLAHMYYGSVDFMWLIFYANDIFDPYYDWPFFGSQFQEFVKNKYGSILSAQNTVHHYEQILRTEVAATADTDRILEKTIHIDKVTYDSLATTARKSISNFDYEILENESKRNIILIEDVYAQQILEESRTIYG